MSRLNGLPDFSDHLPAPRPSAYYFAFRNISGYRVTMLFDIIR